MHKIKKKRRSKKNKNLDRSSQQKLNQDTAHKEITFYQIGKVFKEKTYA